VRKAFSEKFPNATDVKWDKENASEWETEFTMSGKSYSANFSLKGSWKETEYVLTENEVPQIIINVLQKEFKDFKMETAEVSTTPKGSKYEFILENKELMREVVINDKGNIVSNKISREDQEQQKEEAEQDED
jgi:hypothetical protein